MPGGDSGPDGEESVLPSATGEDGREERVSSGQQDREAQSEHLRGEESGASGGEVGQEDEEMTSGSHDLSSSANHSPGSTMGSTSSAKRYLPDRVYSDFMPYIHISDAQYVFFQAILITDNYLPLMAKTDKITDYLTFFYFQHTLIYLPNLHHTTVT